MENNWREKVYQLLVDKITTYKTFSETNQKVEYFENISVDYLVNKALELMNLVFEATKNECIDKIRMKDKEYKGCFGSYTETFIDKDSISNIEKPNL